MEDISFKELTVQLSIKNDLFSEASAKQNV
jgi:hypothetical protein